MAKETAKTSKARSKKTSASAHTGKETNLVRRVTAKKGNAKIAAFSAGDTVNVYVRVVEGEKERVQLYKGVVTKIQGHSHKTFTVRKISAGVGVERTFPFSSPAIESVEIVSHGRVRRAKLYYLRGLDGKAARIESELATESDNAQSAT
jgi:large subunit ribosomal protein L19